MNEEVSNINEETPKKQKKITPTAKFLFVIIIILSFIAVYINLPTKEKEEEDKFKNVVQDKVSLEKLSSFVNTAMYNDFGYEGLAYEFAKGLTGMTNDQKNKFMFQYLVNFGSFDEKITEENIPEKYKEEENISNFNIVMSQLSSRTFEKEYEKVFKETPIYDEKSLIEMNTCPSVYKYDQRIKKIFLFVECKLEGDTLLLTKTYNYKFEDEYYYVYQYVGLLKKSEEKNTYMTVKSNEVVDVDDFFGNESKFETLIWKFDKDYNFISTINSK